MTVTIEVYDKGKKTFEHMALGKPFSVVDEYLDNKGIHHEKGMEHDDAASHTEEKQAKIILVDNTNVLGVDGNSASWVSQYWIEFDEDLLQELIQVLEDY